MENVLGVKYTERICPICNKKFYMPKWDNQKLCSRKCSDILGKGRHNSTSTEFKKGSKAHLGKKHSLEARLKMSKTRKGSIPWNKGIPCKNETKEKLRLFNIGKIMPMEIRQKIKMALRGKNRGSDNGMWKGGIKSHKKYVFITTDDGRYITEHRYVMEKYLKRPLKKEEVVHHINRIRSDNRLKNLKLLSSQREHTRLHQLGVI